MDLFILRHGKAGESSTENNDNTRTLTIGGRKEIKDIGRWMRKEKFRFDIIATSPLMRANETAGIIAKILDLKDKLEVWDELAPGGDLDTICYHAAQYGNDASILMVGHEPALSELVSRIISHGGTTSVSFSKGGLAKIRNFSFDREPSGDLQWLLTPKHMIAKR